MGLRIRLDALEQRKISCPCWESNHAFLVIQPVLYHLCVGFAWWQTLPTVEDNSRRRSFALKYWCLCYNATWCHTQKSSLCTHHYENHNSCIPLGYIMGHTVVQLVEALCYKQRGRGFDSRWGRWLNLVKRMFGPERDEVTGLEKTT